MAIQNMQTCFMRIRSYYPTFSSKEKKIADYILEKPDHIVHGTINQVADEIGIADSTVFRFCKRIGFKGYQAMKIALAAEIAESAHQLHEKNKENMTEPSITEKVFYANQKTLQDTLKVLDEQAVKSVAHAILKARKIEFFGSGGSNIVALDAYHKLAGAGLPVFAQTDAHMQRVSATHMTEQDVAVFISHTGRTKSILAISDIVKESGVKTVAVTNFAKSELSEKVDIPLYTYSEATNFRSDSLASRVAQLTMVDAIYVNVLAAQK